ncbi:MAG TPA: GAF domain-containing protein [Chthoniobacteraceae bacterium]|nr:GAF domain-containing protein [Chthoniobacteraceae bacterium]
MNQDDRAVRWARVSDAFLSAIQPAMPWEETIGRLVDEIWAEFGNHRPVSWVGFYHLGDGEMTLGHRRDKPACSPIGLHGACGKSALSGKSLIVADVRELGDQYIACDPRDLSELVVPVRLPTGEVLGVMDLDSYSVGAFSPVDQSALETLLRAALQRGCN